MELIVDGAGRTAGPIRAIGRVPSGSAGALVLRPHPDLTTVKTVSAALALCRRGVSMLHVKHALEAMLLEGRAVVPLAKIEDPATHGEELAARGVTRLRTWRSRYVRSLRTRLGLSLDDYRSPLRL